MCKLFLEKVTPSCLPASYVVISTAGMCSTDEHNKSFAKKKISRVNESMDLCTTRNSAPNYHLLPDTKYMPV